MEQAAVYVGLDYHQDSVQVCVLDAAGSVRRNRSVGNSVLEVAGVVGADRVIGASIEACSGAADLAEELRSGPGWPVELAHAGYVHRLKGSPDKSDFSDARLLADLTRTGYVPRVWLAPLAVRELRALVRYRQQLVNERRAAKVRLLAVLREQRVPPPRTLSRWSRGWQTWLENTAELGPQARWIVDRHRRAVTRLTEDLKEVEARLREATRGDAVVARLLEMPGVGPVTAWMLRAHIADFGRFRNGKQLARYCGLSPCNASSGRRVADAGMIRAGDPYLKATLVEAGHRLARCEERWKNLAAKLRRAGKPGTVVAVAIANRWVRWLHHQMKQTTPAA
jgi:transposase